MRNFYYICNMCSHSLEVVTRTTYRPTKIFVTSIRVGLKLRRKSEGFAYENAENRYPRRTIRPKIDPARTYAQFQKLSGSPATLCGKLSGVNAFHS